MKFIYTLCIAVVTGVTVFAGTPPRPVYKNKNAPVEQRVNDLVKRMTLKEKILQLNQYTFGLNENVNNINGPAKNSDAHVGSLIYFDADPAVRNVLQRKAVENTRLGIPIIFGFDVIHGFKTIYPIPLAIASSWNVALSGEACAVAAKEARCSGVDWTFSPMIDIGRDPRWGRVAEGYGEDAYTNAIFGSAAVRAYQGKNLSDPYSIAACLKHYVGYGVSEGGRDYRYSDVSPQALWETYLKPYKAGVNAGAATLMSAFNDISGIPASADHYTLTDILKKQWGHDGFVVSDWRAVEQLIAQGVATDKKQAAMKAINAGVEMDMLDNAYAENLEALVKENKVPLSRIDDAVKRILRVKFRLGLFEHPYAPESNVDTRYLQPQSKAIAAKLAEESMVLLKNEGHVLPVAPSVKNIAVIGPMAKDSVDIMGSWCAHGEPEDAGSILSGIQKEFAGKYAVHYAAGCGFDGDDEQGFEEAIAAARTADIIMLCLGEKRSWSGENTSRSTIALPNIQQQLLNALKKTGKPIILILCNGRPLELIHMEPQANAILEAWQPGTCGGTAIARILAGKANPSGKLPITFPLTTGQIPVYYNMRQSARPYKQMGDYQDIPTEPMYWFGYGLSYTSYQYGLVKLSSTRIKKNGHLTAEIEISNAGTMDGKETVLWYISQPAASISRPVKELKFFEKKEIASGQKTVYKFEIDPMRDLAYPDQNGRACLEAGYFYLSVGDQKVRFQLTD